MKTLLLVLLLPTLFACNRHSHPVLDKKKAVVKQDSPVVRYIVPLDSKDDHITVLVNDSNSNKKKIIRADSFFVSHVVAGLTPAHCPWGYTGMLKFLEGNIQYPAICMEMGWSDTLLMRLNIDSAGRVEEIKALKGKHYPFIAEATRVIQLLPTFIPASKNGKDVPVEMDLQIEYYLGK